MPKNELVMKNLQKEQNFFMSMIYIMAVIMQEVPQPKRNQFERE